MIRSGLPQARDVAVITAKRTGPIDRAWALLVPRAVPVASGATRRGRETPGSNYFSTRTLRRRLPSTKIPPTAIATAATAMRAEISAPVKATAAGVGVETTWTAAVRVRTVVTTTEPSVALMVQLPAAPAGTVTVVLIVPVDEDVTETGVMPQPVRTTVVPGGKFEPVMGVVHPAVEQVPVPGAVLIVGKVGP
jgi:hypothetical protein